jgi:hypothetical protein
LAEKIVDEIDLRACHIDQRQLIDQDGRIVLFDNDVVSFWAFDEIEFIGKTRTATAFDSDAKSALSGIRADDSSDSLGRGIR